jgi:hypothetical protein
MAPKNTGHYNLYMIRVFLMQQKFTFNLCYTYLCIVHVFYIVIVKCFLLYFQDTGELPFVSYICLLALVTYHACMHGSNEKDIGL